MSTHSKFYVQSRKKAENRLENVKEFHTIVVLLPRRPSTGLSYTPGHNDTGKTRRWLDLRPKYEDRTSLQENESLDELTTRQ